MQFNGRLILYYSVAIKNNDDKNNDLWCNI